MRINREMLYNSNNLKMVLEFLLCKKDKPNNNFKPFSNE